MRKILLVANWKMNPATLAEARKILRGIESNRRVEVIICPPFLFLPLLKGAKLGAQNMFWEEKGAYTGEISPLMLKNMGVRYVILGHSERRKYFQEKEEMINKKLKAALKAGLKPILCIDKISQIKRDLRGISRKERKNLVIAYEPLFAIGTGKACSLEKAKKMRIFIQRNLGYFVPILYGGSINSQNARDYIKNAGFQGLLVGGASLNPKEFIDIIKRI